MEVKSAAATPVPSFLQQRRPRRFLLLQHHECETESSHAPQKPQHRNESIQGGSCHKYDLHFLGADYVRSRNKLQRVKSSYSDSYKSVISSHSFLLGDKTEHSSKQEDEEENGMWQIHRNILPAKFPVWKKKHTTNITCLVQILSQACGPSLPQKVNLLNAL